MWEVFLVGTVVSGPVGNAVIARVMASFWINSEAHDDAIMPVRNVDVW